MQVPHVLIVISPLQFGVNLYQTSGVLTELPQGVGIEPGAEGVAHIVEPHADGLLGVPIFTAIAFGHKSFGGTVVVCWARIENHPTTLGPVPATRIRYVCPARALKLISERRPQALSLQALADT